jgi:hypothetical protein
MVYINYVQEVHGGYWKLNLFFRGVLDGLLETYTWRPSLTLDFKTFGTDTQSKKIYNSQFYYYILIK